MACRPNRPMSVLPRAWPSTTGISQPRRSQAHGGLDSCASATGHKSIPTAASTICPDRLDARWCGRPVDGHRHSVRWSRSPAGVTAVSSGRRASSCPAAEGALDAEDQDRGRTARRAAGARLRDLHRDPVRSSRCSTSSSRSGRTSTPDVQDVARIIDVPITLIFLADFANRLRQSHPPRRYFIDQKGWLDLLGSLPAGFKLFRIFRVVRVGRLLREYGARNIFRSFVAHRADNALLVVMLLVAARPRVREHHRAVLRAERARREYHHRR